MKYFKTEVLLFAILCLWNYFPTAECNFMFRPQHRGVVWMKTQHSSTNYNYMEINCGGIKAIRRNDGFCGLCGDAYDRKRKHETGGKYATGRISTIYGAGAKTMKIRIILNANQGGYFEFYLCESNRQPETQGCFDQNMLTVVEGRNRGDESMYPVHPEDFGKIPLTVEIPEGLVCDHCVLQWRYVTAMTFGRDQTGTSCLGCGPQMQYVNCADVKIEGWGRLGGLAGQQSTTYPTPIPTSFISTTVAQTPSPAPVTNKTVAVTVSRVLGRTDVDEGTRRTVSVTKARPKPVSVAPIIVKKPRPSAFNQSQIPNRQAGKPAGGSPAVQTINNVKQTATNSAAKPAPVPVVNKTPGAGVPVNSQPNNVQGKAKASGPSVDVATMRTFGSRNLIPRPPPMKTTPPPVLKPALNPRHRVVTARPPAASGPGGRKQGAAGIGTEYSQGKSRFTRPSIFNEYQDVAPKPAPKQPRADRKRTTTARAIGGNSNRYIPNQNILSKAASKGHEKAIQMEPSSRYSGGSYSGMLNPPETPSPVTMKPTTQTPLYEHPYRKDLEQRPRNSFVRQYQPKHLFQNSRTNRYNEKPVVDTSTSKGRKRKGPADAAAEQVNKPAARQSDPRLRYPAAIITVPPHGDRHTSTASSAAIMERFTNFQIGEGKRKVKPGRQQYDVKASQDKSMQTPDASLAIASQQSASWGSPNAADASASIQAGSTGQQNVAAPAKWPGSTDNTQPQTGQSPQATDQSQNNAPITNKAAQTSSPSQPIESIANLLTQFEQLIAPGGNSMVTTSTTTQSALTPAIIKEIKARMLASIQQANARNAGTGPDGSRVELMPLAKDRNQRQYEQALQEIKRFKKQQDYIKQQQQQELQQKLQAQRQQEMQLYEQEQRLLQEQQEHDRKRRLFMQKQQEEEQRRILMQKQKEVEQKRILLKQQQDELQRQMLLQKQREEEQRRLLLKKQKEEQQRLLLLQKQEDERRRRLLLQKEEEQRRLLLLKQQQAEERRRLLLLKKQQEEEQKRLLLLKQQKEEEERRLLLLKQQKEEQRRLFLQKQKEEEQRLLRLKKQKEEEQRLLMLKKQKEEEQKRLLLLKQKEEEQRLLMIKKQKEEEQRLLMIKKQKEEEQRLLKIKKQKEEEQRLLMIKKQKEEEQRLLAIKKQKEEEQRLLAIKKQKEEEQRLLMIKKQKEEEQRLLMIKKQKEEEQRLLMIKKQKEEEQRLLMIKKQKEEEQRLLMIKKQKEEENRRLWLQKQKKEEQRLLLLKKQNEEEKRRLLIQKQNVEEQTRLLLQKQKEDEQRQLLLKQQREEKQRQLLLQKEEEQRQLLLKQQQEEQQRQLMLQKQKEETQRQLLLQKQKEEQQRQLMLQKQKEEQQRQLMLQKQKEEQERQLLLQKQKEEQERQLRLQKQKEEQERQLRLQKQKEEEQKQLLLKQKQEEKQRRLQQQQHKGQQQQKQQQEQEHYQRLWQRYLELKQQKDHQKPTQTPIPPEMKQAFLHYEQQQQQQQQPQQQQQQQQTFTEAPIPNNNVMGQADHTFANSAPNLSTRNPQNTQNSQSHDLNGKMQTFMSRLSAKMAEKQRLSGVPEGQIVPLSKASVMNILRGIAQGSDRPILISGPDAQTGTGTSDNIQINGQIIKDTQILNYHLPQNETLAVYASGVTTKHPAHVTANGNNQKQTEAGAGGMGHTFLIDNFDKTTTVPIQDQFPEMHPSINMADLPLSARQHLRARKMIQQSRQEPQHQQQLHEQQAGHQQPQQQHYQHDFVDRLGYQQTTTVRSLPKNQIDMAGHYTNIPPNQPVPTSVSELPHAGSQADQAAMQSPLITPNPQKRVTESRRKLIEIMEQERQRKETYMANVNQPNSGNTATVDNTAHTGQHSANIVAIDNTINTGHQVVGQINTPKTTTTVPISKNALVDLLKKMAVKYNIGQGAR